MTEEKVSISLNLRRLLLLLPVIMLTGCSHQSSMNPVETDSVTYSNPVISGFNPDPSVCRVGEDYYLVTSSFEYFPGVPVYHSRDLVNWEQIGYCLDRREQLNLEGMGLWQGIYAPVIRYHDGLFYMITTLVGGSGNFYVTASDPSGPWSDPVWVDDGQFDPSLFFDDDGKVYYTRRGPTGIVQAEIDLKTGKLTTPLKEITRGLISRDAEGPHLYKINGWYYIMIAEGGTRFLHMETIARSRDPWGPFEPCPFNPILAQHEGYSNSIRSTGHAELVNAHDGSWWMFFLATRHTWYDGLSNLGRETFLAPVTWKDGWPYVEEKYVLDTDVRVKTLPLVQAVNMPPRDDFTSDRLELKWMHLRNPVDHSFSLTEKEGVLRLYGNQFTLSDLNAPAFVGQKQKYISCVATARLSFLPVEPNEEAGLTVYQNDRYHYDLAVTRRDGRVCLVVRKTVGDIAVETARVFLAENSLCLRIRSDERKYYFEYSSDEKGEYKTIDEGLCQLITTELASTFTGAVIAMYASGNGRMNSYPAEFDWFEFSPLTANMDH